MTRMASLRPTPYRSFGVALLLAFAAGGCADAGTGAPRSGDDGRGSTVASQAGARSPDDAATVSDEIGRFAGERFPKAFAQVSVDGATTVVHRVRTADGALDHAVRKRFPSRSVRFVDAPRSATELDALTGRIAADHEALRTEGIRVGAVGPDYAQGVVVINVEDPSSARATLTERYGPALRVSGPGPEVTPAD